MKDEGSYEVFGINDFFEMFWMSIDEELSERVKRYIISTIPDLLVPVVKSIEYKEGRVVVHLHGGFDLNFRLISANHAIQTAVTDTVMLSA